MSESDLNKGFLAKGYNADLRNQEVWQLSVKPVAGRICALQLPNEIGASFIVVIAYITLY
jgi:hypothetical protein